VIFIIPGAGRNGTTYRDAWIEHAEKHNVLVLTPEYNEASFPGFWSYNLAGMIKDVKINKDRTGIESYNLNLNEQEWILNDFDKIFNAAKDHLKLTTNTYDLFGHSAGGQLLHRLAMYKPGSKANRILTSNAGWYTVPDRDSAFPYGLKNSTATDESMRKAFNEKLVVLLGEKDNENETRGDLVRSKEVDVQGIHRLARGKYFYDKAQQYAKALNAEFNWKILVVPNVGHDHAAMSQAAARYLYEGKIE
jgi:pimeloyl-ACP methyl ester carboxylesterase